MSILAVGDLHGDWGSFNNLINKKKPEIILQCGDFGYWPSLERLNSRIYKLPVWKLRGIKSRDTLVYWCDGNHEEFPRLYEDLKREQVNYDSVNGIGFVVYAPRGSILELPDKRKVLFIGGASSVDKNLRTPGIDWFPEENITNDDLDLALEHEDEIDIIISHTCPVEFDMRSSNRFDKYLDSNREALSLILEKYKPDLWYFGHWHCYKIGQYQNTKWTCLDYPKHGSKWWEYIK